MFVFFLTFIFGLLLKAFLCASSLIFIGLVAEKIRTVFANIMCYCRVDLSGKVVVVTGGNSGIGFETAKILAKRGARVIIASRNAIKSEAAVEDIIDATGNLNVEHRHLDLGSFSSIKRFADDFNRSYDRLDVLINHAGTAEREQRLSEDGIDRITQINHVGPTYLTTLLLDKIIASKPSRIIFVSSILYKNHSFDPDDVRGLTPCNVVTRYANSKLANILVARALSRVVPEGVTVNSLHPGTAATEIFGTLPKPLRKAVFVVIDCFFKTCEECAQTSVHLASAPALADVTGQYFDECRAAKLHKVVTDELADEVWKNTLALIEETTRNMQS